MVIDIMHYDWDEIRNYPAVECIWFSLWNTSSNALIALSRYNSLYKLDLVTGRLTLADGLFHWTKLQTIEQEIEFCYTPARDVTYRVKCYTLFSILILPEHLILGLYVRWISLRVLCVYPTIHRYPSHYFQSRVS